MKKLLLLACSMLLVAGIVFLSRHEHEFTPVVERDDEQKISLQHYCKSCKRMENHIWNDGFCSRCGFLCPHKWEGNYDKHWCVVCDVSEEHIRDPQPVGPFRNARELALRAQEAREKCLKCGMTLKCDFLGFHEDENGNPTRYRCQNKGCRRILELPEDQQQQNVQQ